MNFKSFWESLRKFRTSGFLFIVSFFLILYICNYWTYLRIKQHPNYTIGKVVKTRKASRSFSWHSQFTYTVAKKNYSGELFGQYDTTKAYIIVYDDKNPRYSTIVDYPYDILDSTGKLNKIDLSIIDYDWQRYIPNYELTEWLFGK